jgi:hypothetical protein
MLDWLAPDQEGLQTRGRIELTSDRAFYQQGESVAIQAEWIGRGAVPFVSLDLTIKAPSGKTRPLTLQPAVWKNPDGRRVTGFRGETAADATGVHQAEARAAWAGGDASATISFAVAASPEERRGESPDAGFLHQLATQSGGAYFARGEGDKWLETLPKPKRQTEREVVTDIWNHPLVVVLLLGSLCGEWWFRRRRGLA